MKVYLVCFLHYPCHPDLGLDPKVLASQDRGRPRQPSGAHSGHCYSTFEHDGFFCLWKDNLKINLNLCISPMFNKSEHQMVLFQDDGCNQGRVAVNVFLVQALLNNRNLFFINPV